MLLGYWREIYLFLFMFYVRAFHGIVFFISAKDVLHSYLLVSLFVSLFVSGITQMCVGRSLYYPSDLA